MKRLVSRAARALASRATTPAVLGIFLTVYIVLAFVTEETLVALMAATSSSVILMLLLCLLPVSSLARLSLEAARQVKRRRVLSGAALPGARALYDEAVEAPGQGSLEALEARVRAEGYRTARTASSLGAWRGWSATGVRLLFLAGTSLLFAGIAVSLGTRSTHRASVIEGEPLPTAARNGGVVEKIALAPGGAILRRDLIIDVAPSPAGDSGRRCRLYPPSLYRGYFVYPRYPRIALGLSFAAPDLPGQSQSWQVLNLYPAGREDEARIPDSPYRLHVTLTEPADGSDPFESGGFSVRFKLLKGEERVLEGTAPLGKTFVQDGYRIDFPGYRRAVTTDFVRDYGVFLIWGAFLLFAAALFLWLLLRLVAPRQEMVFIVLDGKLWALSRAERRHAQHAGIFHEQLDFLAGHGGPASATAGD